MRFRDIHFYLDAGTFKESEHPRGEDGKFAKALNHTHITNTRKGIAPNRKVLFSHEATGSAGKVLHFGEYGLVTGVHTPEPARGKGGASHVMREITAHLDKNKLAALLYAIPDKDDDFDKLVEFYHTHGFIPVNEGASAMVRKPK